MNKKLIEESLSLRGDHWIVRPIIIDGKITSYEGGIIIGDNIPGIYPQNIMWITQGNTTDIKEAIDNVEEQIYNLAYEGEYYPEILDKFDKKYYKSPEWNARVVLIKRSCGNKCEKCHQYNVKDVHHLTYENAYCEPLEDLMGLCGYCHLEEHGKILFYPRPIISLLLPKMRTSILYKVEQKAIPPSSKGN